MGVHVLAANRLQARLSTKKYHVTKAFAWRKGTPSLSSPKIGGEPNSPNEKTTPTSNKTTQNPSINPDLRTVESSMSSTRAFTRTDRALTSHTYNPTLADR